MHLLPDDIEKLVHRHLPSRTPVRLKSDMSDAGIVWKTETLGGVLKGSRRAEAARRYLDFLATPVGQAAYASFGFVKATPQELAIKPIP